MTTTSKSGWIVVTTINEPPAGLADVLTHVGHAWDVVVVGDRRTSHRWRDWPVEFLSLERQHELFGDFAAAAPIDHYARKNFGYLYALQRGATAILEVDDDGTPYPTFGTEVGRTVRGRLVGGGDWANVYRWFTDRLIWPRGLPLDAVHRPGDLIAADVRRECPVHQFLVDDDPDVDAIFRYLFPEAGFRFAPDAQAVILEPGTWCPFNTQNTLWFEEAFPLLYLPHFCSFRVTDIWRSLVAQQTLWLSEKTLAIQPPTLAQRRNPHDLARDFADEIPCYTQNRAIAHCLQRSAARLAGHSLAETGRNLWRALIDSGFLPEQEAPLLDRWFDSFTPP